MKRASDAEEERAVEAQRNCRQRVERCLGAMRGFLDVPASIILQSCKAEVQAALQRSSIEHLVHAAREEVESAPPDLCSLRLGSGEVATSSVSATGIESPESPVEAHHLPSLGLGLTRQKTFGSCALTDEARIEESEAQRRCASAIARLVRRSDAQLVEPR